MLTLNIDRPDYWCDNPPCSGGFHSFYETWLALGLRPARGRYGMPSIWHVFVCWTKDECYKFVSTNLRGGWSGASWIYEAKGLEYDLSIGLPFTRHYVDSPPSHWRLKTAQKNHRIHFIKYLLMYTYASYTTIVESNI